MPVLLALLLALPVRAAGIDPAKRAAAMERLAAREAAAQDDPAALAAVGKGYLALGAHGEALAAAERALETSPQDGEALAVKARALRAGRDLEGALAVYRAIPRGHPQAAVAAAQIRDLEGALARMGRPAGTTPTTKSVSAAAETTPRTASGNTTRRLERAFRLRGLSKTLEGTIRKAGNGRTRSLADLERAGIHFELGRSDQKDAVEVREEGGRQVVSVNPAVLDSPRNARVAAQFGRGLEEAATQRDYDGIGRFIRKIGGRVKAVRILIELDGEDRMPERGVGPSDRELLKDRAVTEALQTKAVLWPDKMEAIALSEIAGMAEDADDASDVAVMIESIRVHLGQSARFIYSTQETGYLNDLGSRR